MITQLLLDWVAAIAGGFLALIPPMPPELLDAVATMIHGGGFLGTHIALLGPLVPFGQMSTVINWWLGLLVLWTAVTLVRAVLWALGR